MPIQQSAPPGLDDEYLHEKLLLVGSCNGWDAKVAKRNHRFIPLSNDQVDGQQRSRLRMHVPAAPFVFQIISATRFWDWRVYPSDLGNVPCGYHSRPVKARLACGEDKDSAQNKNFSIDGCSSSAVVIHVLLSKHIGIRIWYEEDAGIGLQNAPSFKPRSFLIDPTCSDGLEQYLDNAAISKLNRDGFLLLGNVLQPHELTACQREANSLLADNILIESMQKSFGRTDKYVFLSEAQCTEGKLTGLRVAINRIMGLARMLHLKTGCAGPDLQRARGEASPGANAGVPSKRHAVPLRIPQMAMLAAYDGKATRYPAHRDNALSVGATVAGAAAAKNLQSNARHLTLVLYLNDKSWQPKHGGALRCHLRAARWAGELTGNELRDGAAVDPRADEDGCTADCPGPDGTCHVDVQPRGGQLVIFFSRELLHEVLPAHRRRWALSLWIEDARIEPEDPEKTRKEFAESMFNALTRGLDDADKEELRRALTGRRLAEDGD